MSSTNYVIRVYGLVITPENKILLSDEFQANMRMNKFPGGGLEPGEGTIDCLRREFREECNGQEISNIRHFYTTDFYQEALFHNNHQLLSIYYLADLSSAEQITISEIPFDFKEEKNGSQSFRWADISTLSQEDITFPVDKHVLKLLQNRGIGRV